MGAARPVAALWVVVGSSHVLAAPQERSRAVHWMVERRRSASEVLCDSHSVLGGDLVLVASATSLLWEREWVPAQVVTTAL